MRRVNNDMQTKIGLRKGLRSDCVILVGCSLAPGFMTVEGERSPVGGVTNSAVRSDQCQMAMDQRSFMVCNC